MTDNALTEVEKKSRTQYTTKTLPELMSLLYAGHRPATVLAANVALKASVKSGSKATFHRLKHAQLQYDLAELTAEAEKFKALYEADQEAAEAEEIKSAGAKLEAARAEAQAAIARVAALEALEAKSAPQQPAEVDVEAAETTASPF